MTSKTKSKSLIKGNLFYNLLVRLSKINDEIKVIKDLLETNKVTGDEKIDAEKFIEIF